MGNEGSSQDNGRNGRASEQSTSPFRKEIGQGEEITYVNVRPYDVFGGNLDPFIYRYPGLFEEGVVSIPFGYKCLNVNNGSSKRHSTHLVVRCTLRKHMRAHLQVTLDERAPQRHRVTGVHAERMDLRIEGGYLRLML